MTSGLQHHHHNLDHHQVHQQHSHMSHPQQEVKDTLPGQQNQRQHLIRNNSAASSNNELRVSNLAENASDALQKKRSNNSHVSPTDEQDNEATSSNVRATGKEQQQYLNEMNPQEGDHDQTHSQLQHEKVIVGEGTGEGITHIQNQRELVRHDHSQHKESEPITTTTAAAAAMAAAAAAVSSVAPGSSTLDGLKQAFGNSLLVPPQPGMAEGQSGSGQSYSSSAATTSTTSNSSLSSFSRPLTSGTSAMATNSCSLTTSSSDCFSPTVAQATTPVSSGFPTDLLSRYRLEQTLRHLHSFQDPRIAALPFNSNAAATAGIHQQDQL